jgi:hypothetical protein
MKNVFCFLAFSLLIAGSSAQTIQNPGFEDGSTGWTLSNCSVSTEVWGIPVPEGSQYCGNATSWTTFPVVSGYQVVSGNTASDCRLSALCTNYDSLQETSEGVRRWRDNVEFRIGLDPSGTAAVGGGESCGWSSWARWGRFQTPQVTGCGSNITVWFLTQTKSGGQWAFAYFDDFEVEAEPGRMRLADFEGDSFCGPFYSTTMGTGLYTLAEMMLDTPGPDTATYALVDPITDATEESGTTTACRAIGTFLMEAPANMNGTVKGYMRCPGAESDVGGTQHWMELGYKAGRATAYNFDASVGEWTLVQKFDGYSGNAYNEGNNDTWTLYQEATQADANGEITLGIKLGNAGGGGIDPGDPSDFINQDYGFDDIEFEYVIPEDQAGARNWSLYY